MNKNLDNIWPKMLQNKANSTVLQPYFCGRLFLLPRVGFQNNSRPKLLSGKNKVGSSGKSIFRAILDSFENLETLENPQTVENKVESALLEILENVAILEILEIPPVKRPLL